MILDVNKLLILKKYKVTNVNIGRLALRWNKNKEFLVASAGKHNLSLLNLGFYYDFKEVRYL